MRAMIVIAAAGLLGFVPPAAQAEFVQQVDLRVRDSKASGAFTLVASATAYDTNGGALLHIKHAKFRFPTGLDVRRQFLKKPFLCDVAKLRATKDPAVCATSQIGKGRFVIDLMPYV